MSQKSREGHLRRTYGLTLDDYAKILRKQNGNCAVCKRPSTVFKVNLAVDHDHKTGEIYGLLCTYCNRRVIGRERRWEIYEAAAAYLKSGQGIFVPKPQKRKRKQTKKRSRKG